MECLCNSRASRSECRDKRSNLQTCPYMSLELLDPESRIAATSGEHITKTCEDMCVGVRCELSTTRGCSKAAIQNCSNPKLQA